MTFKEMKKQDEELAKEYTGEEIIKVINAFMDRITYEYVSKPIDPKYCQKVKEPKHSVDDLLDQGYSLRQIQQIIKGEN